MKGERQLLDCTLRDGGYVNDWQFGSDNIAYLFEREVTSGVDFIEVGFLDARREFDPERTIQPDTASFDAMFRGLPKHDSRLVAMIDLGTCPVERVAPKEESALDGIRVIFKKDRRQEAVRFGAELKRLGYLVFIQAVSITDYTEAELSDLVREVNGLRPYALSMVDTYGLLDDSKLMKTLAFIDERLAPEIAVGYHAHNNFQLGYANAVAALRYDTSRTVLVDGSLYGMGKSAGNAPIELIAMYMNEHCGKSYDVLEMQEAISSAVMDIYEKTPWGYKLFFYIAALNHCHPDYVAFLMNKRTLSVSAINEILKKIPPEEKLKKNMALVEKLYLSYQNTECDDTEDRARLRKALAGKEILLIGPGKSVREEEEKIRAYAERGNVVTMTVNHTLPGFRDPYLFLTNVRRYNMAAGKLANNKEIRIVATSNVRRAGGSFDYTLRYSSLLDSSAEFPDNSLLMALRALQDAGASSVTLAGFDGYTPYDLNFYDGRMAYDFVSEKAETLNSQVKDFLRSGTLAIPVRFLTKSRYEE